MMKRIIAIIILLIFCLQVSAEKIRFSTHSFLDDNGVACELYAYWKGDSSFVCAKILTKEYVLDTPAILMLKTSKGKVIKLEGIEKGENKRSEGTGTVFGNFIISGIETTTGSIQLYPITKEQIEMLREGIVKIRINTLPALTEKTFNKDEIGQKLYKKFQETRMQFINF